MPVVNSVSVTAGSPVVTGYLTAFVGEEDDLFLLNGEAFPIFSVDSTTQITLKFDWAGATLADQTDFYIHRIGPNSRSVVVVNQRVTSLIDKLEAGLPFRVDATGTLAERTAYDDQDTNFIFLRTDSSPQELYIKRSVTLGDWSAAITIQGEPGPTLELRRVGYVIEWRPEGTSQPWVPVADLETLFEPYRADAQASAESAATSAALAEADRIAVAEDRTAIAGDVIAVEADRAEVATNTAAAVAAASTAASAASDAATYAALLGIAAFDFNVDTDPDALNDWNV